MKILHTSDWHLGKRLDSFSRLDEQKEVLDEICLIANEQHVDVVIISGDLFDTFNPSIEATELFYKTLKKLSNNGKRLVFAIAGNHDSPDRIEAPDPLARECGIILAGYPDSLTNPFKLDSGLKILQSQPGFIEIQLPDNEHPLRILSTPYANELRLKSSFGIENPEEELQQHLANKWTEIAEKQCDNSGVNILVSHLFFAKKGQKIPDEPEEEKPILYVGGAQVIHTDKIPKQIQYTALGHLHRMQMVDNTLAPVVYCGSPLSYSFSEANQRKYVLIAEIVPGTQAVLTQIELKRGRSLLRYKSDSLEDILQWLAQNQSALVELTVISDDYLTAEQRVKLNNAHSGIVSIIPEVRNKRLAIDQAKKIDLSKDMEELFTEYFEHVKGQKPNGEILNLFRTILAEEKS